MYWSKLMSVKVKLMLFLMLIGGEALAQTTQTIEGKTYTNSEDTWLGVNISRSVKTKLIFRNNSISSINRYGYLLQAGDESPTSTANNLDNAVISGNRLNWTGTDMKVIPHGIFTGHNSNVVIKYNYVNNVPMGIIRKSGNNMSNTGGGVAYNIIKGGAVGMVIKGMSNVNVYNNTFYTDRTTSETWRPLLHIYTNTDAGRYSVAHGTKIYNNIFYTKYQTFAISIDDNESLQGLECDYNIYWSESGSPKFNINGSVKTFEQWQAMGYDTHSKVINPGFKDFVSFVPSKRLDYGKELTSEWKDGLAVNAKWGTTDPATSTQNGTWQVGAVVYAAESAPAPVIQGPAYTGSVINDSAPAVLELNFNSTLAGITPPLSAFSVSVNSASRSISSLSISGTKVMLSLQSPVVYGDSVKVSYTKPSSNPLQGTNGGLVSTFNSVNVLNKVSAVVQAPSAPVYVSSVIEDSSPSKLEITYSQELAQTVPPDSSFITVVNGVTSTVKSVSVSGSKVILTLSEQLKPGDVISLSYVKPSINGLISKAGTLAESFSGKTVVNKIIASDPDTTPVEEEKVSIFPNPAKDFLSVKITNPVPGSVRIIRIYDFSGKLCFEKQLETDNSHKLPINLKSGFYLMHLEVNSVVKSIQKLIVIE